MANHSCTLSPAHSVIPCFFHRPSPYLRITTSGEVAAIQPKSAEAERLLLKSKVCDPLACGVGVPFVGSFGIERDYNAIAVDLLGPSLEDIFHLCNLVPTDHSPSSSNTPFPSLAHLITYSLHRARLMSPITSTTLYLLQRLKAVRATLLFSSQRASERLLALTNPCWPLPIGCSWFTEVESKALLPYTPLKVKIWR